MRAATAALKILLAAGGARPQDDGSLTQRARERLARVKSVFKDIPLRELAQRRAKGGK